MKIPDYRSASDRRARGTDSYLDHFITEFQPVPPEAEDFRDALRNVLDELANKMLMESRERTKAYHAILISSWSFIGLLIVWLIMEILLGS